MNPHLTSARTRLLLVCGLAAALALAALTTLAHATTPGRNGLVAFTRYRLQNNPLWSEIFVANADGTGARKVSHSPTAVEDDQAHWSPDGKWIVFDRCTANGPCSIWLVGPDGSGQRRLSPTCPSGKLPPVCVDESNPSFAPDGKHVVFQHESGKIRHGPTGDQIERSAIVLTDLAGKHLRVLRQISGYQGDLQAPRLSPNGKQLLFERYNSWLSRPRDSTALFVVGIDGRRLQRITPWAMQAAGADWSPDGTDILFHSSPNGGDLVPGSNLYTVHPDGTGLRQLTHVPQENYVLSGSYSPDGTSIVYATDFGATANPRAARPFADVFTTRVDGTNLEPVTRTANLDGWPTWGPASG